MVEVVVVLPGGAEVVLDATTTRVIKGILEVTYKREIVETVQRRFMWWSWPVETTKVDESLVARFAKGCWKHIFARDCDKSADVPPSVIAAKDAMLQKAAEQFFFYRDQHLAKGTQESREKADVNYSLGVECVEAKHLTKAVSDAK